MDATPWKIVWTDALSMHNPEIDAQHQRFAGLVNELNAALIDRREKSVIVGIMQRILDDAVAHFAYEERLFAEKKYPLAQTHAQRHAELVVALQGVLSLMQHSDIALEWMDAGLKVKQFLIEHLIHEDVLYIDYLRTV